MVVLVAANALAGTGVGGIFNLGQTNSANQTSTLTGASNGAQLQVTNTASGQNAIVAKSAGGTGVVAAGGVGTGVAATGDSLGGSFSSPNIGLHVSGPNDGVQASATGLNKSGVYAHHDGATFGYGVFAHSDNGPALGLNVSSGQPPCRSTRPLWSRASMPIWSTVSA